MEPMFNHLAPGPGEDVGPLLVANETSARAAVLAADFQGVGALADCYHVGQLLVGVTKWLAGQPAGIEFHDAPPTLRTAARTSEDRRRWAVMINNLTTNNLSHSGNMIRYTVPLREIRFSITSPPGSPAAVYTAGGAPLRWELVGGKLYITLPRLDVFEGIFVEF